MKAIAHLLRCLEQSPGILNGLVASIPKEQLKTHRITGKWSIHEHACHLVDVQPMLLDRFRMCFEEENPHITPYLPGETDSDDFLLDLDLDGMLTKFPAYRTELIDLVKDRNAVFWDIEIVHPEYRLYTPYILLRHILMHDHLHMYRIEELWLTTDEYLPKAD